MRFKLPPLICILLFACQLLAQTADETAIKAVIEAETTAFCKVSMADVVKQFWILDDKTVMCASQVDGTMVLYHAAELLEQTEAPPENHATFQNSNYQIYITGNLAVVNHDQVVTLEGAAGKQYSHEIRVMEKVNGVWKIHVSSVHKYDK
jgi:antirestriction protein ArdC